MFGSSNRPPRQSGSKYPWTAGEGRALIIGFLAVSLIFGSFVWLVSQAKTSISLPMLSIAGLVLLLICLAAISYVFTRLDLHDRTQALGLPAGSIQAVIALSLVVLFAILSVFLFEAMKEEGIRRLSKIAEADRDALIATLGATFAGYEPDGDKTYTVFVRDPGSAARTDIAKQLIVLIGTLMTSAVGFYFGSRATAGAITEERSRRGENGGPGTTDTPPPGDGTGDARDRVTERGAAGGTTPAGTGTTPPAGAGDGDAPRITGIRASAPLPRGEANPVTILGVGLADADGATLSRGEARLEITALAPTAEGLTCGVAVGEGAPPGAYDLTVTKGGAPIAALPGAVTVAEPG